jgi:RNase P subunit RPR2
MIVGNDDPNGAGTGAYRIKLWDVPPPDKFTVKLDDLISKDKPDKGAGYIENPGSSDVYTFTADAGQLAYFQVQQPPQTNDTLSWRMEDEAGSEIFNTCLQCGDPGLFTLEHGGTYTITVGNKSGSGTGTYTVKFWSVAPPDEFDIKIGDTVTKGVPRDGAGFIASPGEQDIYHFTATAGQTLTFTITQPPTTNDTMTWRLTDESGKELFNTCLQCGDPQPVKIESDGTYTLTVGSTNSPGTGAYGFQITAQ